MIENYFLILLLRSSIEISKNYKINYYLYPKKTIDHYFLNLPDMIYDIDELTWQKKIFVSKNREPKIMKNKVKIFYFINNKKSLKNRN